MAGSDQPVNKRFIMILINEIFTLLLALALSDDEGDDDVSNI